MKILELVHAFPPAHAYGTELYTYHLSRSLLELGHEVEVLYPVLDEEGALGSVLTSEYEGVTVHTMNVPEVVLRGNQDLERALDAPYRSFLRDRDYELVHIQHLAGFSGSFVEVARDLGVPQILKLDDMFYYCPRVHLVMSDGRHCHGGPETIEKCVACVWPREMDMRVEAIAERHSRLAFRRSFWQTLLGRVDLVYAASQFLYDSYRCHGFDPARFRVLRTGIFPFERRARVPAPDGRIRVGYLGALQQRKGVMDLLEAVDLCLSSDSAPLARTRLAFSIFGDPVSPPILEAVRQSGERWPSLRYLGTFAPEDRARIFAEIDVLVVPSRGENYPFILREALHAGVPVIATRIAGIPEIVDEGRNGFLFSPGDVRALAEILLRLAREPELLQVLDPAATPIRTVAEDARDLERLFFELRDERSARASSDFETLIGRAKRLVESRDLAGAEALYHAARVRFGDRPEVLQGLGVLAFHEGHDERAAELFARAHRLDPGNVNTIVNWAWAVSRLHRLGEISDVIEKALRANPEDKDLRCFYEAL